MYTTGEIAQLCEWTRPRVGVVLNVGPVHLERAGSLEAIARAKRELVEALPADGFALLNADDPAVAAMAGHTAARVLRFGTGEHAEIRGSELDSHGAGGFTFTLEAFGEQRRVRVPLPGAHLLPNVLAAAAVGLVEGVTFAEVADALEALDVPLRLTVRCLPGGITLLDDTYNASPAATRAALDLLGEMSGRRIALLGDMLELGELAASHRTSRSGGTRAVRVDTLYTVGELAALIAEGARAAGLGDVRPLGLEGGGRGGAAGAAAAGRRAARQGLARARPRNGRGGTGDAAGRGARAKQRRGEADRDACAAFGSGGLRRRPACRTGRSCNGFAASGSARRSPKRAHRRTASRPARRRWAGC